MPNCIRDAEGLIGGSQTSITIRTVELVCPGTEPECSSLGIWVTVALVRFLSDVDRRPVRIPGFGLDGGSDEPA